MTSLKYLNKINIECLIIKLILLNKSNLSFFGNSPFIAIVNKFFCAIKYINDNEVKYE